MTLLTGFDLCRAAMSAPGVTAPERSVLMVLAIMANAEAKCWPPINDSEDGAGLTTRCVLSERAVQRAIQQLVKLGHITRRQLRHGVIYTIHPVAELTPATQTGVSETPDTGTPDLEAVTPATQAPKLPETTIPSDAIASSGQARASTAKRGTSLPKDFEPQLTGKTAEAVAKWPPGDLANEIDQFRDWHAAHGTASKDWDASFRTWVRNAEKFRSRNAKPRHHRPQRSGNGLLDAVLDAERAGYPDARV